MRSLVLVLALPFLADAAAGQDSSHPFFTGVYETREGACDEFAKYGSVEEAALLTSENIVAYEYTCSLAPPQPVPGQIKGWVAAAICETTATFPDVVSIVPREDGTLVVTLLSETDPSEDEITTAQTYYPCDGLDKERVNRPRPE